MWQVEIGISGMERLIVGPFPDDQEDDARAVHAAWQRVAHHVSMMPGMGDFKVGVILKKYSPLLPNTDEDWLYSRYVQPAMLDYRGS